MTPEGGGHILRKDKVETEKEEGGSHMDIVKNHCGAYGAGVEYAYTMVHGAPATKYPEYVVPAAAAAAAHTWVPWP